MKEILGKLMSLAGNKKITKIDTLYGELYAVEQTNLRLEHHFKSGLYKFAMIVDADLVLHDIQL